MSKNERKHLKILLVQTANMNLGDEVLADNDEYLLRKALRSDKHEIFRYNIASRDIAQVKYVDAMVFAGGILKTETEKFWLYIPELIKEAQRLNIPVFLSAVGVEKFIPGDERSEALKEAINLPCVKGISVRDDIETLQRDYITNKSIRITSVYDPAVWCKKTYRSALKRVNIRKEDKVIGLGIIRHKIFEDYGHPEITKEFQLNFWKGVADELDKRGLRWKIFTNGDANDEAFAKEVMAYIDRGSKQAAPINGAKLAQNIYRFKGVIGIRMHSNIISYALGIPSVGVIWNQKLAFWAKKIGHPERFLKPGEMNAKKAVDILLKAMEGSTGPNSTIRNGVYEAMKDFVKNHCRIRDTSTEELPFKKVLVAQSLGGIDVRYKNTNSAEAFYYSVDHGFKNLHVDLRLTSDRSLVCVNRWHKETYNILGVPLVNEGDAQPALSDDQFLRCKYYNRFRPLTFETFLCKCARMLREKKLKVILSVGKPSEKDLTDIVNRLKVLMTNYRLPNKCFMLRLERKKDIEMVREAKLPVEIIYHLVDGKHADNLTEYYQSSIKYCKSHKIKFLTARVSLYTPELPKLAGEQGIKTGVFSYVLSDKIIDAIHDGAALVGSNFYSVEYLDKLTK